ncbi:prolipoprotein diacylglyceryl transferase [Coraliomargarita parva]|uniref:prolipoprotein diacylglyceryl transferase n=1 Tax=Coraliomargarita parva TaxID=3014050 RepID=UPI0022B445F8|nr:prolipoprotein diacylglyceryl transferase [Coraliomargarita parva]
MATPTNYWVHDLSPFLVRFPENPLGLEGIRYYGLAYLAGFIVAWALLRVYNNRGKYVIDADARATLMTAIILGVLAGGRLGYMLLYDLDNFLAHPASIIRVDQGGMASHGGFVGVILALVWFAWRQNRSLLELGDIVTSVTPIGLFFGRIANFINGELWGRVTEVRWAVIFPDSPTVFDRTTLSYAPQPRHPSQLYEAGLEGLLLFIYLQFRLWFARPPFGQLAGEFLFGYGIVRIIGELFREPDAGLILGLSRGQFYSIFLMLAGLVLIVLARLRGQREPSLEEKLDPHGEQHRETN